MRGRGFTILVHRDGDVESRQWYLPRWLARATVAGLAALLLILAVTLILYGPIVAAAARTPLLEHRIAQLERENQRVNALAQRLDEAEARYAHLRGMLGGDIALPEVPSAEAGVRPSGEERLFVAPPMLARLPGADSGTADEAGPTIPRRWPLSVPSYRTRGLAQGDPNVESHTGLDLAVPVGSEVRASGGGRVKEAGTDSSYGRFVLLEHLNGFETMYGHLSRVLVARGDLVTEGQVIALSGDTGRSTAPHLHFEIRRGGRSVDPLTMLREGS